MDFSLRERYTVYDLAALMELLRSDNGCPWDREQTHRSIRTNVIEEAYEVADAIDRDDPLSLCEELGDLLLQVVFQAQMSKEEGTFDFDDVADGICRKMILRHPHIFGKDSASNSEAVLELWEQVKQKEKGQTTATQTLQAVPKAFPALLRSQKVQARAARTGFAYPDTAMVLDTLRQETLELEAAINENDINACKNEVGDVLFSAVQMARMLGFDAEEALHASCEKFIGRFSALEQLATEQKVMLDTASVDEKLTLWAQAKKKVTAHK